MYHNCMVFKFRPTLGCTFMKLKRFMYQYCTSSPFLDMIVSYCCIIWNSKTLFISIGLLSTITVFVVSFLSFRLVSCKQITNGVIPHVSIFLLRSAPLRPNFLFLLCFPERHISLVTEECRPPHKILDCP